jgi:hypothetical protein
VDIEQRLKEIRTTIEVNINEMEATESTEDLSKLLGSSKLLMREYEQLLNFYTGGRK